MNIFRLQYNEKFQALEIYLPGCDGLCNGCHNKELWDFDVGEEWVLWGKRLRQVLSTDIVKVVWVMGGEPLLQDLCALEAFLCYLSQFKKPIMLWTRFYNIPENIRLFLDYAKVGDYQDGSEAYTEPVLGIKLASGNQRVIKI